MMSFRPEGEISDIWKDKYYIQKKQKRGFIIRAFVFYFFTLLLRYLVVIYLNIPSSPGMFGMPSFATAPSSASFTDVAFAMALFITSTR